MYTIIDAETTGFPKNGGLKQDGQARVVQIAAILCEEDGTHIAEFCTLIRPDGWVIGERAQETHGISQEKCEKSGIDQKSAIKIIAGFIQNSKSVVAHNAAFDLKMLDIEFAYADVEVPEFKSYCTMLASLPICKLPGQYGNYKWPKLIEALPIICGRDLGEGAHDAMVDARGAKDLFFELMKVGAFNENKTKGN